MSTSSSLSLENSEVRRNRSFSGFLSGRKRERAVGKPYKAAPTTLPHGVSDSVGGRSHQGDDSRAKGLWRSNSLLTEKEVFPKQSIMQPAGVQVMPAELVDKLKGMQAAPEALKGVSRSAAPSPMPLSQSGRRASEDDIRFVDPKRGTFRRRMSQGKGDRKVLKRSESPGVHIEIVPGTFRKVSGIREERDGLGKDTLRTIEIRRSSGVPLGFNFQLLKTTDGQKQEAEVTDVESGSVVDCQQLVRKGDRLVRVNGIDVATIKTAQDLRLMMQVVEKLTLTVRTSASSNNSGTLNTFRSPSPPKFTGKRPVVTSQSYSEPYVPGNGMTVGDFCPIQMTTEISTEPRGPPIDDRESPYDEIELYAPKEQTKRSKDTVDGSTDFPDLDLDLGFGSARSSIGLMEYMEGVMNVFLDKDISSGEKQRRLKEKLGVDLRSPTKDVIEEREEEVGCHGPSSDAELTPSSVDAERYTPPLEQDVSTPREHSQYPSSSASMQEDLDHGSYLEVHSEDLPMSKSGTPVSGVLQMVVVSGSGFLSPGSELKCVLSTGEAHCEVRSTIGTVTRNGSVEWDDFFEMDVHSCERLTASCYTVSYDRRDRLCARGTVYVDQLFALGNKRRLHLSLTPRGSLQLLFRYVERERALIRIPSDDQYFGTFGNTLQQLTSRDCSDVPLIVTKLIHEIERRGLRQLGLYCVSGSFKMKQALRDSFEADCDAVLLSANDVPDITIIATLLKDYLSQLPEPLLTHQLYKDLITAARHDASDDARRHRLFNILQDLPEANLATARVLFRHFKRVIQNSTSNKLSAKTLSRIMGPVLLSPAPQMLNSGMENLGDVHGQADVVEAMLSFSWPDMAYTREETTF